MFDGSGQGGLQRPHVSSLLFFYWYASLIIEEVGGLIRGLEGGGGQCRL